MKTTTDFVFHDSQTSAAPGNVLSNADGSLYVAVSGTFEGTIVVQGMQAGNWFDLNIIDLKTITSKEEIDSTGAYMVIAPDGFEAIRCNITSLTSGSVTVTGRLCSK